MKKTRPVDTFSVKSMNESQEPKINVLLLHYSTQRQGGGEMVKICAPWATKPLWSTGSLSGVLMS